MSSLTQNDEVLDRLSLRLPHLRHALRPVRRVDELDLDSIDLVELLCAIESEFNVRLRDGDLDNAQTVGKLAELIELRRQENNS